jgi:hypothetical protein
MHTVRQIICKTGPHPEFKMAVMKHKTTDSYNETCFRVSLSAKGNINGHLYNVMLSEAAKYHDPQASTKYDRYCSSVNVVSLARYRS